MMSGVLRLQNVVSSGEDAKAVMTLFNGTRAWCNASTWRRLVTMISESVV